MFTLFLDTNVFIDALAGREPFQKSAKLILALGSIGEFKLWISASQATDIFYILSDGGKRAQLDWASEKLTELRKFVNACAFCEEDIDAALASTWKDFEDACLNQVINKVKPDAFITGNTKDFVMCDTPVMNCDDFFAWLEQKHNVIYEEMVLD
ncbi:MAG: PIN domain-containing protein [Eggerthellaceae bacterium]|nr:PIN domain-containing protein [Eggerthellaceae bacterium]